LGDRVLGVGVERGGGGGSRMRGRAGPESSGWRFVKGVWVVGGGRGRDVGDGGRGGGSSDAFGGGGGGGGWWREEGWGSIGGGRWVGIAVGRRRRGVGWGGIGFGSREVIAASEIRGRGGCLW